MIGINWIHIIDDKGVPIIIYENYVEGTRKNGGALLSHFLSAMTTIAKKLKEHEIKTIIVGNDKFFLSRSEKTDYLFIIKSNNDMELITITPILNQIKDLFVSKHFIPPNLSVEKKRKKLMLFKEDLLKILEPKSPIEKFLDKT